MHRSLLGILIALTFAALSAPRAEANLLAGLDANGDGVVTRPEFDAARLRDFRLLDRNGNKVISRREFYRRGRPEDTELLALRKRRYRLMDVNDDGGITGAEYIAYGHKVFARMDANRDRRLAAGEVAAARGVQIASQDVSPADTDTASPRPAKAAVRDDRDDNVKALGDMPFGAVDTNGDGTVSRGEYRRAVLTLFRRLDTNRNKVISRKEYYWRGSVHDKVRLPARKAAYRRADDDDDGGLTAAEFLKMTRGLFARIDRSNEGKVSRAEWLAAFGSPATTAAAPRDTGPADRQTAKERLAVVSTVRDGKKTRSAPTPPAPQPAKVPETKAVANPADAGKLNPETKADTESALLANMRRSMDRKLAKDTKRAPQVASRPPASETPKAADDRIDPRVAYAFRALDRDRDGKISELELAFARMARFAALDANRDQILQPNEFIGNRGAAAAARFREMDRDGDGRVTWEEYKAAGNQRFQQLDADRDKHLSLAEFANAGRVNNSKVHYVKRVKVKASPGDERVMTPKQAKAKSETPFEYERSWLH